MRGELSADLIQILTNLASAAAASVVPAMVTAAITARAEAETGNRNFTMRGECRRALSRNDAPARLICVARAAP
jgi:hypothetical protein